MKIDDPELARWLLDICDCVASYGTGSENLAPTLNQRFGPEHANFEKLTGYLRQRVQDGTFCVRENGGIRFDRLAKPSGDTHGLSIDLVYMKADPQKPCVGPHHIHTAGEVGMIMPEVPDAVFDAHHFESDSTAGWYVYPPGHDHFPTADNGSLLVLYLLPEGQIEFTGRPAP